MATEKPEQLAQAIKADKLRNVYVFDGPEDWLKERALSQIIQKTLTEDSRDFNMDRFDASDCSVGNVVNAIQSVPFLSKKRVVVIRNGDQFKAADGRVVADTIPNMPDSTCLIIFWEGKAPLRDQIVAQASSKGAVITFWTPFANQLPAWVATEAKLRGKTLDYSAARAVAESCTDLQEMSNELDKLILFVGKKNQITYQDVLTHGLPDGWGDFKQLADFIWSRNFSGALHQGQLLFEMGIRAEMIFPVFERIFRQLLLARHYLDEKAIPRMEMYGLLGLRGRLRQNQLDQALRAYTSAEIRNSFSRIVQANMDLKTGRLTSDVVVSLLICQILGKKEAAELAFG